MKMARAKASDIEAALEIAGILDEMDGGYYPRRADGKHHDEDPTFFDENDPKHLRALYDALKAQTKKGGLFRVVFGMSVLLDERNEIVDTACDNLQLHPRLRAALDDAKRFQHVLARRMIACHDSARCDDASAMRESIDREIAQSERDAAAAAATAS